MGLPAEAATLRKHSTWFLIYGIVLIVLGGIAILAPSLATLAVEFTVAWLLLIAGCFGLVAVFSAGRTAPGFWWNLLTAIVCVLAGLSLMTRPVSGAITLTILLAAYFLASGVVHIVLAFGYKAELPGAWLWMLVSGVVDIVLALIIMSGLPGTAGWVLGLLVGINLLMLGVAIVFAALAIKKTAGA
jgi:uncharacterized membrane protein HdeD (DUF308 family)